MNTSIVDDSNAMRMMTRGTLRQASFGEFSLEPFTRDAFPAALSPTLA